MLGRVDRGSPFGQAVLVVGRDGLVAERTVGGFVERARAERPSATVTAVDAFALTAGSLAEMTGGSLLASDSVAVIRDVGDLLAELHGSVIDLVRAPEPDLALVLTHPGGVKGKAIVDAVKKAGVLVVVCDEVKTWELPQFVMGEGRRLGVRIDVDTASALVDAVGQDLRSLAAAVSQLLADNPDRITTATISRYFGGRADVTSFAVADEVMAGRAAPALEKLRWALSTGVSPVLVTSALANSMRGLGKYLDASAARLRDVELAKVVGVPPWKLKDLARLSRDWRPEGVARGLQAVAVADAAIKGAASDPGFALERLVLSVTRLRGRPPGD
jgi:DNA polymerase III subunit delta